MNGERQRLRPWLESQINSGHVPQLIWLDKTRGIFKVPWKHAGKPGFVLDRDAVLFREWARHTGKYRDGEQPDPSTWKTRFRCAINKLPDIDEIKKESNLDGDEPYRVFQFLPKGTAKFEKPASAFPSEPTEPMDIQREGHVPAGPFSVTDNGEEANAVDDLQENLINGFEDDAPIADPYFVCSPDVSDFSTMPQDFSPPFHQRPMEPSYPMEEINKIIGMNPQAMEVDVKIYYNEKLAYQNVVSNSHGCRIHSGVDLTHVPGLDYGILPAVYGPHEAEQIQFPDQEGPKPIMGSLNRGLLLQWQNNSIVATRFCQAHVYASGGCLGSDIQQLVRCKKTTVFDYDNFLAKLAEYRLTGAPLPLYEVFFAFGQRPATSFTVDPGVLITVSITHLTAKASISKMGSASDVVVSLEDEGDLLAKNLQQVLHLQSQMVPPQPRQGVDA